MALYIFLPLEPIAAAVPTVAPSAPPTAGNAAPVLTSEDGSAAEVVCC